MDSKDLEKLAKDFELQCLVFKSRMVNLQSQLIAMNLEATCRKINRELEEMQNKRKGNQNGR